MCAIFDVSVSFFDSSIRPLLSSEHTRLVDRQLTFYCRGAVEDWSRAKYGPPDRELSFDEMFIIYLAEKKIGFPLDPAGKRSR